MCKYFFFYLDITLYIVNIFLLAVYLIISHYCECKTYFYNISFFALYICIRFIQTTVSLHYCNKLTSNINLFVYIPHRSYQQSFVSRRGEYMQRSKIEKNDLYVHALQICSRDAQHVEGLTIRGWRQLLRSLIGRSNLNQNSPPCTAAFK